MLAGFDLSLLLFFYAMLALFISQYTRTAGAAAGATGALYALFFVLDGTGRAYPNLAWVQRLSPNYYYGLSKPLIPSYGTNFGAMALLLALGLLLLVGSAVIFLRRDMGAVATLPFLRMLRKGTARTVSPDAQIDRAARDPWLRSVLARSLRAGGPGLGWWMLGVFLYAAYGAGIVKSSEQQLRDAIEGSPAFAQLFGANLLATDYGFVSLAVFLIVSIAAMLYALIRANDWPANQDNGRLDIVLSTPQPRWRVALQWYGTALVGFILLALANALGIIVGSAATGLTLDAGRVFAASLALVPPMALIAGAVYALGARLRSTVDLEIVGALSRHRLLHGPAPFLPEVARLDATSVDLHRVRHADHRRGQLDQCRCDAAPRGALHRGRRLPLPDGRYTARWINIPGFLAPSRAITHPSARATTPRTMPLAATIRRRESPSESRRAPMIVPIRMLISRAGAT